MSVKKKKAEEGGEERREIFLRCFAPDRGALCAKPNPRKQKNYQQSQHRGEDDSIV